jgi:hypothetical protein
VTAHAVRWRRHAVTFVSRFEGTDEEEGEVVDGLPVVADERTVEPAARPLVPARQAAALAATGFVAGAATVAVVHRRRTRVSPRRGRGKSRLGEIVASNSFLVDVNLIRRP